MSDIVTERVSPAKAEKYLNANKSNRTMRTGVAEKPNRKSAGAVRTAAASAAR